MFRKFDITTFGFRMKSIENCQINPPFLMNGKKYFGKSRVDPIGNRIKFLLEFLRIKFHIQSSRCQYFYKALFHCGNISHSIGGIMHEHFVGFILEIVTIEFLSKSFFFRRSF